jgi:hypothetical protein
MSREFYPAASSLSDGSDTTLCRILESVSGTAFDYEFEDYVADGKPQIVVIKRGSEIVSTITITYDGSNNVASITRS